MPTRRSYSRKRSRSKSVTKRTTKKPRRTRSRVTFKKRGRGRLRRSTSRAIVKYEKLPRDARPSEKKQRSKKPTGNSVYTNPRNEQQVVKQLRPAITADKQDKLAVAKGKSTFKKVKDRAKAIGQGIAKTADVVGKVAEMLEPILAAGTAMNPELAPLLLMDEGMAEAHRRKDQLIEGTASAAERGKDAYAFKTDTGKLRKIMGNETGAPPLPPVNLITMGPAGTQAMPEPAPFPPMADRAPRANSGWRAYMGPVEVVD
ncbi:MAG: hypothetical protein [Avonheates virus Gas_102]|nr:MAG: hypothetical protein [Avonheates virus Gas_102]